MMFSRVFSLFSFLTCFLTFSFVASNPITFPQARSDIVAAAKPQNANVASVLNTLQGQVSDILPEIDSLVASDNATGDSVTPLIGQLTVALSNAANDLAHIPTSGFTGNNKRQSNDEIANLIAGIVTDITSTLDGLLGSAASIPTLGALLSGLDVALNQVLVGLETLLAGVLNLVATLLVDVAGLLSSLSLGLVLGSLGL
ncbi:hypothetical protein K435DRAFT_702399 [Dendrothele bispora CBS 962.96]|uniref:Sc15 protein n=1 Tax=Dendrothele bispora (strain CBS 962.96) TaxID=1314807 RepID=A0A4S8KP67_DENBC|nr:hypothetical protein K435DRAFT_702399 [Dendrothele bispora CBS 962.96]